jgi:predicted PurR-regulated permease PerM
MRVGKQLWFWLASLVILVLVIALLKDILLPFVSAIVIAYFLNPLAERLQAQGVPRVWSAILIVGVAAVLVALALVLLVPVLVEQVRQLFTSLPQEADNLKMTLEALARNWFGPNLPAFKAALDRGMKAVSENWAAAAAAIMGSLWSRGLAVINFVSLLLITPVVVFYILVDWHPMLARIDNALPRDYAATIRRLAGDINEAVSAFIRGQGTVCLILGIYYAIGLSIAGLNYGLLVGISTGLLAFIPIAGWVLGLTCAASLALVQSWPELTPLAKVVGVLLGGLAIDTAFLSPRFVGQKVGLHPVWLIFALFVFSYLLGFVGTLVAVPLAAAIGVIVRFAVQVYLHSSVYKGGGEVSDGPDANQLADKTRLAKDNV